MAATIAQIAARAGVSPGTVSRVLNKKTKGQKPAIARRIARIEKIARQMGYRPNTAARSVRMGSFRFAAFVTCRDRGSDWIARLMLHGIHDELEAVGMRMVFNEVPAARLEDPDFVPALLAESSVDALLVSPNHAFTDAAIRVFETSPTPLVWLNHKLPRRAAYPDDLQGAIFTVEQLHARGHERIVLFSRARADRIPHYSELDREAGYAQAMTQLGLPLPTLPQGAKPTSTLPPRERAEALLDANPQATAFLCYGMEEAILLHTALTARGARPGSDPTSPLVMGFCDGHIHIMTGLPIATALVPFERVGREAVRIMNALLRDRQPTAPSVAVPFTDIIWPGQSDLGEVARLAPLRRRLVGGENPGDQI